MGGRNRAERQKNLIKGLKNKANSAQVVLQALLSTRRGQNLVKNFTPLWIQNAIAVTANSDVINEIARLPLVQSIVPETTFQAPAKPAVSPATAVETNIGLINSPALWSMGYQGQGVVIGSLDTGVDYTHPDLAASWRGGTNSWYDPNGQHSTEPTDLNGHGTWTMGVTVGGSASGSAIGVAPQARWIAAKIFNDSGTTTSSVVHLSYQWMLDPDGNPDTADGPNIINNSWAFGATGCNLEFEPDLAALVAAGILPVFAAGNYGPLDNSSTSPANNPSAFSVGAINNTGTVSTDSSRGPTNCGGSSRSFPSVVAPGVNILTTDLYGFYYTASGTSLAAPHVSGGAALLFNAFPDAAVAQIEQALTSTAYDLGPVGVDNSYGNGRINLLAAYNYLINISNQPTPTQTSPITPTIDPTQLPTATPSPTITASPIPTATSTPVPTMTPTATPTKTSVPTPTRTPLPTTTVVPTPTRTPVPTLTPTPTPAPGLIFSDDFESGSLGKWSAANTDGGRLSVTVAAAFMGSAGMQANITNTTPIYVSDTSPKAENIYHARFSFSPHGVKLGTNTIQDIFVGLAGNGAILFSVQLKYSGGNYQVRVLLRNNSGTNLTSNWSKITNGYQAIEIAWSAASTSNGKTGYINLWLNGKQVQTITGVANGSYRLEEVRLGPSNGLHSSTSGIEYFDSFVSNRTNYIGV